MIGWRGHLREQRLIESCFAARHGESVDPRAAEHLADCPECRQRYAELNGLLDATWAGAEADTDSLFPPERLRAQRQEIAHRLEQLAHGARVISFPGRETLRAPTTVSRVVARWTAVAAAAGLFVGISVGVLFQAPRAAPPVTAVAVPAAAAPVTTVVDAVTNEWSGDGAADSVDDGFMWELELAVTRPQRPELLALDALTPQAREINYVIR